MSSILTQIRSELQDRLESIPFFATVPILTEDHHDLGNEITRVVGGTLKAPGGKPGAAVVLLTPEAKVQFPDNAGPVFEEVDILARVFEHPTINRASSGTGLHGAEIAEQVAAGLQHFRPESANGPVMIDTRGIQIGEDPVFQVYDVHFKFAASLRITLPQVVAAVLSQGEDGRVTMTCGTAGAAIFYTVDGSLPMPRHGTLYRNPVALSGVTVKGRAFLAGYLHSTITALTAV